MKLIKFSALWCPSCLIMNGRINKIINKYNLECVEYDYDVDTDKVDTYKVGDILPVFILLDNDQEVTRLVGEKSVEEIENKLRCFE